MKKITLSFFIHHKINQIKIEFDYDFTVKQYIKKHPLVKWSKTHKTFYLPFSKQNANSFCSYLNKNNYKVDYSQLVNKSRKRKQLPPLEQKFYSSIGAFKKWLIQMRYSQNTIKTYISMIELFLDSIIKGIFKI